MVVIIISGERPIVCGPFPSHVAAKMWWDTQKMFDEKCEWKSVLFFHIMPSGYQVKE